MNNKQKVRVAIKVVDFLYSLLRDATASRTDFVIYLEYSDGNLSDRKQLKCSNDCIDGQFSGFIDINNNKNDNCKVSC